MTNTPEHQGICPSEGVSVLLPIMPSFLYIIMTSLTDVREEQQPGAGKEKRERWSVRKK